MSIYQQNKAFFSQPYRLSAAQQLNPVSVFETFFDCHHLHQAREALADMMFVAISSQNEFYSLPRQREDVMYFRQQLEEVLEAAWLLCKKAGSQAGRQEE